MVMKKTYYQIKPFIPRRIQIGLRRRIIFHKRIKYSNIWPIDGKAGKRPEGWEGWPEKKQFAFVLTHDVESEKGFEKISQLVQIEKKYGFRSCFNFVGEDYPKSAEIRRHLSEEGFEIGLHGLRHNGNLFESEKGFKKQAEHINRILRESGIKGFRTPSMYHNLEMLCDLNIEYDSSTFDTDPFEPQPDGVGTIFPFWVSGADKSKGYIEMPYTLPQDFGLFVLMREKDIDIWKRKLDWIAEKGGMALLNSHPDYLYFDHGVPAKDEYPVKFYEFFLEYVRTRYDGQYWHVLPKEMARYWAEMNEALVDGIGLKRELSERRPIRQLRVAMLTYSFYDSDARVARYAETLAKRGDHVDVISLGQEGQGALGELNGVNILRIQKRERNEKRRISFLLRMFKFFIKSSRLLNERHRKNPYDLIHVHSVPDFEVFAAWVPKLMGAKIILDIHDINPEFYVAKFKTGKDSLFYRMLILIERLSIAFSDHVIVSNHIWGKTLDRSVKDGKCSVYLNYPDASLFHKRPRVRDDRKFIMIYPGTLNWHQGLDIAIGAFSLISDLAPGVEFHIYGQGDTREVLLDSVRQRGLEDKIIFHNMLSKEKIAEVMADADLGVVPKRNDSFGGEAFSTKTLEFMSLGVPILVSATKIDRYYFNDSVVKFFKPEDMRDLADKMFMLIRNRDLRENLAESASKFIKEYTWDKKEKEYLNLVDSLVERNNS